MANRSEILSLYRRCLRSMLRIPDVDQRAVYRVYVRDAFRDKATLAAGCKQAANAISDAREQLERMDYYHSIREMKERQKLERQGNGIIGGAGKRKEPYQPKSDRTIVQTNEDENAGKDERCLFARQWLLNLIPHLHKEDVAAYSERLVNDGFDCEESFVELQVEDLDFMKVAHKRMVVRALFS